MVVGYCRGPHEASGDWSSSGSLLQEVQAEDDAVLVNMLAGGGFAEGIEGDLQLAILVLSILGIAASLLSVWGFVILRILGMHVVRKQV